MKTKKLLSLLIAVVMFCTYNSSIVLAAESITTGSTVQSIDANNLVWEKPTGANPFGGAANFNGMIFGEISGLADSEGPVAGNGNIIGCQAISTESGVLYGSHTQYWVPADDIDTGVSPHFNIGLMLGGTASSSSPVKNGDIVLGTNANYTGGSPLKRAEVDTYLDSAKADLIAMSTKLFSYEANGTIDNTGADKIIFTGTNAGTNVFEIDYSVTKFDNKQVVFNIPEGATVLFNVIGSGVVTIHSGTNVTHAAPYQNTPTLNGKAATAEFAGRILYNFDSRITRVNSKAGTNYILGSMLAPLAEVHGEKGDSSINGTLVASKISGTGGGFELHYFPFRGSFTDPSDKTGQLSFTKYSTTQGQTLPGATFTLSNGTVTLTATSGENGLVSFANIASGTYTLKEITAPTGYTKSSETISVTINSDGSNNFNTTDAEIKFVNAPIPDVPGNFSFVKYAKTTNQTIKAETLAGAVFALTQGAEEKYTATSASAGTVSFTNIPTGTYTLSEKTAPTGYIKSDKSVTVVVANDGKVTADGIAWENQVATIESDFENNPIPDVPGQFGFTKTSITGVKLDGAVFTLTQGTQEKYSATSNTMGTVSFSNIASGTYTLTEKTAPTGYTKSNATVTIVVAKNGALSNDTVTLTATSDANGLVSFSNIASGTYTLAEINAPDGYTKSNTTVEVIVTDDGKVTADGIAWAEAVTTVQNNFENSPIADVPGQFSFTKYTTTQGETLPGATFALTQNGVVKYTAISASAGTTLFSNILPGTYTLTEESAPNGYTKSTTTVTVVVAKNGEVTVGTNTWAIATPSIEDGFKNAPIPDVPGQFGFTKYSISGETKLDGAVFTLTQGTQEKYSATSNTMGTVSFSSKKW